MLKLIDIKKDYNVADGAVQALKGINLEFRKNEFVAILGQSGCGKTTLLNIIGGLDKYTSGDLVIDNRTTKEYKDKDWDSYRNHSVGFVFQSYNLIPHLSVLGNVELALTLTGVSSYERKRRAKEVLVEVGLGDQINKKPNQLSGGQMQRVAIARALVNNPEILLADEPTGALDSQTSIQIMDLIKKIAKDRLVIMVTHNPELANQYASRIIRLIDGLVVSDSNPYDSKVEIELISEKTKKTSMSYKTALALSFKNLLTKKFRTIITAFAGSIGIIGIALVLSLSNGFTKYIDKMQADTLSSYPITISESDMNIETLMTIMQDQQGGVKFPTENKVFVNNLLEKIQSARVTNVITEDYLEYISKMDSNLYNDIKYSSGYEITNNIFSDYVTPVGTSMKVSLTSSSGGAYFQKMLSNNDFIHSQYDLIYGTYPKEKNELILVVDQYNKLNDATLMALGLISSTGITDISFDKILEKKYTFIENDELYELASTGKYFIPNSSGTKQNALELEIVGVLRTNEKTQMGALTNGIAYLPSLEEYALSRNVTSEIINWMKIEENQGLNPTTGQIYSTDPEDDLVKLYNRKLRELGGNDTTNDISIYAKDFNSKVEIKKYLDEYNVGLDEENQIQYSDIMAVMVSMLNTMINGISIVLIAFTAISLVVSTVMIGIITYVSVIERTKEIGILRSIGARKKDISNVFNAETFIIGLTAGLFGVVVTFILTFPINAIVGKLVDGIGNIASLNIIHAIILIIISICLTLISGFFPARVAAKKDPVVALRTE